MNPYRETCTIEPPPLRKIRIGGIVSSIGIANEKSLVSRKIGMKSYPQEALLTTTSNNLREVKKWFFEKHTLINNAD